MAEIQFSQDTVKALTGKVVVLTGGAQGIGAAAVALYHSLGAHVYFGDWDDVKGKKVEQELQSKSTSGSVHFQKLDVRDYSSQLALFNAAFKEHGQVDTAVSCAAVAEPGGWFEPENLDLESVQREPVPLKEHIDINLVSVLSFCRIALAYMKASKPEQDSTSLSKSIVLVSSIAGITEAPGLISYSTSKHGVIGLMRSLRPWAPLKYGVRANAICPWATDTQLLGVKDKWVKENMPMNTPHDVGKIIVQCSADQALNGKAIFVTGGRFFDTEEGIDRTLPQWMGEQNAKEFLKGQEILGLGESWTD
ncbi:Short-chain dehydrogenase reductase 5 [Cytospora mali]|uniref:Short-chain dehydrogenase reductase 5 n=1 Tax=Cytospora mali TaxID=578113 RepID=A0A194UNJ7_CYTMA|nr:Short-chain dehydrogenase reductase 5 [Valsa mali var. pyri (nom. inval.)]